MMDDRVERLSIRCVAPADRRDDALALERRLRRIARDQLPDALGRVLPGFSATMGSVSTRLPESIAEHDDATIALLWASEIARSVRSEASAVSPTLSTTVDDATTSDRTVGSSALADVAHREPAPPFDRRLAAVAAATTAAATWWAELETATSRATGLQALAGVLERLGLSPESEPPGVPDRRSLVRWLEVALRTASEATISALATWFTAPDTDLERVDAPIENPHPGSEAPHPTPSTVVSEEVYPVTEAPSGAPGEAALLSRVGGMTLLYPWLGRLLTIATDLFGEQPEVRMGAIWTLLDTPFRGDPLLAIIAGADPDQSLDWSLIERTTHPLLDDESDRIWQGFADMLPGTWRKQTLVSDLIVRSAFLHRDDPGWVVSQSSRPLDLLVAALPYPTTYFQFGWSPPISVRWPDG